MLKLKYLRIDNKLLIIKSLVLIIILYFLSGCADRAYTGEEYLLGTICRISVFKTASDDYDSEEIVGEAFNIVVDIEKRMSVNIADSEISIVNNNRGIMPGTVSHDILFLIEESISYSIISQGRFDITVGPLVKLWNIGNLDAKVPKDSEIAEKLRLVDYNDIEVSPYESTVYLKNESMMIDLGGIAKGFAADKVKAYLLDYGVRHAIINMGGNVLVIGENPEKRPWKIGIQNPFMPGGTVMGVVEAIDESIVTSGIYERYFIEDNVHYHHILNTDTGYPVNNSLVSVTIITNSSTKADALSTGIFALGYEDGILMIENMEGVDAVFITKEREVYLTSGIKNRFSITDDSFIIVY